MRLATKASRSSKESTSDVEDSRVRPSPQSSKGQLLERDAVRLALEGEGLDDELAGAHLVEGPVEAELVAVTGVDVVIGAAGAAVPGVDSHLVAARPEPLDDEPGVGMRAEDSLGRGVELPDDPDEWHVGVDSDLGLVGAGAHTCG
jgi:hypothetical protein